MLYLLACLYYESLLANRRMLINKMRSLNDKIHLGVYI
jgi:hypothetical protein